MKTLRIAAFVWGIIEFRSLVTSTFGPVNEYTAADHAYDLGREFAHRVTLRRYEP